MQISSANVGPKVHKIAPLSYGRGSGQLVRDLGYGERVAVASDISVKVEAIEA